MGIWEAGHQVVQGLTTMPTFPTQPDVLPTARRTLVKAPFAMDSRLTVHFRKIDIAESGVLPNCQEPLAKN